jgi:hypothetical protein
VRLEIKWRVALTAVLQPDDAPMTKNADVFDKVVDWLSRYAAPKYRKSPIICDTEVYRDLKLYGDDLFELSIWLYREFGVRPTLDPGIYAPGEQPFLRRLFRIMTGLDEPQYKSLKVRDIIAAIEAKRWPDAAPS